ncbi:low molecular weight protein-tyrosine-phosphatase [Maricaulis sp.]|uniref:low molecular weight protein-tyrosine-phosphatase n=1 Tax=Maricaulis sp. TaxID=1486257 RepID=UPI00261C7DFA|nr:low molecular weight protein-tyrosine-phosphatase [Maricaulis sp.]
MRVLFVCTGNICRSPTAEAVARARVAAQGLDWDVDSAGTGDWHAGEAPDARAAAAARHRGYDLTALRARAVTIEDFQCFDHLIALDAGHEAFLRRMAPPGSAGAVSRLLDWTGETPHRDVPDPYYGADGEFETVLDMVEAGVDGLIAGLRPA